MENGEPLPQGIVVGCTGRTETIAMVDTGDVHTMMIGAAGVGRTARAGPEGGRGTELWRHC